MLRPASIEEIWDFVKDDIHSLLNQPVEACATDIRAACQQGDAQCLVGDDLVLIVRIQVNPHDSARELVVWWASSTDRTPQAMERGMPQILQAAEALDCKRLRMGTLREGWLRLAPKFGWQLANIEFVRDVH